MEHLHRVFSFGFFSRTELNFDCLSLHTNSFMLIDRISFGFMNFHFLNLQFLRWFFVIVVVYFWLAGTVKPLTWLYLFKTNVHTQDKHTKISAVLINQRSMVFFCTYRNLVNKYFIFKKKRNNIHYCGTENASMHTLIN